MKKLIKTEVEVLATSRKAGQSDRYDVVKNTKFLGIIFKRRALAKNIKEQQVRVFLKAIGAKYIR